MWKEGDVLWQMILDGVLIGVLASLSGLGGGFMVVPFMMWLGKKSHLAVGTSFLVVFMIALSSLIAHWRLGHIEWKTGFILAIGGVVGAQIGPVLLANIPDVVFKRGFATVMIGIGLWLLWSSRTPA